jgi:hypothetical protein
MGFFTSNKLIKTVVIVIFTPTLSIMLLYVYSFLEINYLDPMCKVESNVLRTEDDAINMARKYYGEEGAYRDYQPKLQDKYKNNVRWERGSNAGWRVGKCSYVGILSCWSANYEESAEGTTYLYIGYDLTGCSGIIERYFM